MALEEGEAFRLTFVVSSQKLPNAKCYIYCGSAHTLTSFKS